MMLRTQRDSLQVLPLIQDFTTAYPKNGAAMLDLASYYARQRQYAKADAWLQRRFTLGGDGLDAVYDTQAQLIYEKALTDSTDYPAWNLEAALKAAEKSYALQAKPAALLQQGVLQRFACSFSTISLFCSSSAHAHESGGQSHRGRAR